MSLSLATNVAPDGLLLKLTNTTEPETIQISKNSRSKSTRPELPKISRHSVTRFYVGMREDTSYFDTTPVVAAK